MKLLGEKESDMIPGVNIIDGKASEAKARWSGGSLSSPPARALGKCLGDKEYPD